MTGNDNEFQRILERVHRGLAAPWQARCWSEGKISGDPLNREALATVPLSPARPRHWKSPRCIFMSCLQSSPRSLSTTLSFIIFRSRSLGQSSISTVHVYRLRLHLELPRQFPINIGHRVTRQTHRIGKATMTGSQITPWNGSRELRHLQTCLSRILPPPALRSSTIVQWQTAPVQRPCHSELSPQGPGWNDGRACFFKRNTETRLLKDTATTEICKAPLAHITVLV